MHPTDQLRHEAILAARDAARIREQRRRRLRRDFLSMWPWYLLGAFALFLIVYLGVT